MRSSGTDLSRERRWLIVGATVMGMALGIKHLGLVALAVTSIILAFRETRTATRCDTARTVVAFAAIALAIAAPWYVRVYAASGNPVFPEMYWCLARGQKRDGVPMRSGRFGISRTTSGVRGRRRIWPRCRGTSPYMAPAMAGRSARSSWCWSPQQRRGVARPRHQQAGSFSPVPRHTSPCGHRRSAAFSCASSCRSSRCSRRLRRTARCGLERPPTSRCDTAQRPPRRSSSCCC